MIFSRRSRGRFPETQEILERSRLEVRRRRAPPGHVLRSPIEADAASIAALYASIESALYGESETGEADVALRLGMAAVRSRARRVVAHRRRPRVAGYAWVWGPRLPRHDFDGTLQIPVAGRSRRGRAGPARADGVSGARDGARPWHDRAARARADVLEPGTTASTRRWSRGAIGRSAPSTAWSAGSTRPSPRRAGGWHRRRGLPARRRRGGGSRHDQDSFAQHFRWIAEPLRAMARAAPPRVAPELTFHGPSRRTRGQRPRSTTGPGYEGWIGMLGVRRAWRRHGLATALLLHSFAAFQRAGCSQACLGSGQRKRRRRPADLRGRWA